MLLSWLADKSTYIIILLTRRCGTILQCSGKPLVLVLQYNLQFPCQGYISRHQELLKLLAVRQQTPSVC